MTVTRRLLAIFWAISQILCFLTTILVVGVVRPHGNVGVLIEEINNADNIQGVDDNVSEAPDGVNDGQDHMNEAEDGDEKSDASSYTDDEEFWNPSEESLDGQCREQQDDAVKEDYSYWRNKQGWGC
ncbi:hypothetical protein F2Q70_00044647 [Brassica cretica]|uniref:Uncharacterized protein n=1 Tax=Brassica cretica TaxID=69181 RepID=A0A8S9KLG3_BRACR|nr:hypothetical protein F2Q70_00044647 [Brassica cretica]KAF2607549.1 hypothetical protein F2Q68_00045596 [Brassica cretica]